MQRRRKALEAGESVDWVDQETNRELGDPDEKDRHSSNYRTSPTETVPPKTTGPKTHGAENCGAENCGTGNYSIGNCAAGNCTADSPGDNSSGYRDYRRVRNADAGDENTGVLKRTGI